MSLYKFSSRLPLSFLFCHRPYIVDLGKGAPCRRLIPSVFMVTNCSSSALCLNYLLPLSCNGHLASIVNLPTFKRIQCGRLLQWLPGFLSVVDLVVNLAQITCQAAVIFTTMTSFGSEQSYQNPQVVGCRLVFCGLWSNDIWFYNVTNLFPF